MTPLPHYCPFCAEHHQGMCMAEAGPLLADLKVDVAIRDLTIADLRHKLREIEMRQTRRADA